MRVKKLISVVMCVTMILGNTLTYVNAEDLNGGSLSAASETQTIVEPVFVDASERIATESDAEEEDGETATGNYEEEPEGGEETTTESVDESSESKESEESTSEETTNEETTSGETKTEETTTETVAKETTETETKETVAVETEAKETTKETTSDNSETTNTESTTIIESSKVKVESAENIATLSVVIEETTEATYAFTGDGTIATSSEVEVKYIELATVSTTTSENLFGEVATSSEFVFDYPLDNIDIDYTPKKVKGKRHNKLMGANIPSSYDSRDPSHNNERGLSIVPPVRNQNPYGLCWSFSMMAQMETSLLKKNLTPTNEYPDLSEAALGYYMWHLHEVTGSTENIDKPGLEGYDHTLKSSTNWENGGNRTLASLKMSSYMGAVKENDDTSYQRLVDHYNSYTKKAEGYTLDGKYAFNSNAYEPLNIRFINKSDINEIKEAIMDNGSVGLSYFHDKTANALHVVDGDYYFCSNNVEGTNHAIVAIGWDDNISCQNFYYGTSYSSAAHKMTKNGAWLCRNSWGEGWGNEGYFWISYYETSLDANFTSIEATLANTYEYNYHYDTSACPRSYYISNAIGNIFKVSDDKHQSLDAISIALDDNETDFDIEIYTSDTAMTNPTQGTRKLVQRESGDLAGIWTIPLNKKVLLKKGTYFSIVIKPVVPMYVFYDENYSQSQDPWFFCYNEAALGQSFRRSGSSWIDINTNAIEIIDGVPYGENWRIKGLTNPTRNITFNAGGGTGTMEVQAVLNGEATPIDANKFTRAGYTFNGWSDGAGHTYADKAEITITSDITLTAQWKPITYTITYNTNKGEVSPKSFTKTYGTNVTLATPERDGYTFANWCSDKELKNVYTGNKDLSTTQDAKVEIFAKWTPNRYNITLDLNGGTKGKTDLPTSYLCGTGVDLPYDLTKGDLELSGWYKYKDFTGDKWLKIDTETWGNITLYAKYADEHIITYLSGGGKGESYTQSAYEEEDTILIPNRFTKDGYSFSGWSASNGKKYNNNENIGEVKADLTLTATWKKNSIVPVGPSGGGGSSGGGGGGGGRAALPDAAPATTENAVSKPAVTQSVDASLVTWSFDINTNKFKMIINVNGQNTPVTNGFFSVNSVEIKTVNDVQTQVPVQNTYYFDTEGQMVTGWVKTVDNNWYFFENAKNVDEGKMITGWKQVQGSWYFFQTDGAMLSNTTTPDGYLLGADGKMLPTA